MSFVDTRIKLNLKRLPRPLPDNYNLVVDVSGSDACSRLIDSLPMRIAVNSVESASVKLPSGDTALVQPGSRWADLGLKEGLEYVLEVRGQAMDFEVGAADDNSAPIDYISNEEYDKKEGTVRDYLRKNKLGKFSEDYQAKKLQEEKEQLELYESLKGRVNERVELENGVRGELKFIGETEFATGFWAGVALDEPYGKNDGTVKGRSYFKCVDGYGIFLRLNKIKVGDYPPIDDGLGDDSEII